MWSAKQAAAVLDTSDLWDGSYVCVFAAAAGCGGGQQFAISGPGAGVFVPAFSLLRIPVLVGL